MRSRVELLRNLPAATWGTVVGAILARPDTGEWARGREKLAAEGVDWLRRRLIREGKDVLSRYDQLLPPEKRWAGIVRADGRRQDGHSTPSVAGSMSPPPNQPRAASTSERRGPSRLQPVVFTPPSAKRPRRAVNNHSNPIILLDSDDESSLSELTPPPRISPPKRKGNQDQVSSRTRSLAPAAPLPKLTLKLSPAPPGSEPGAKPRFILSSTSTPCIIEAARKREDQIEEAAKARESRAPQVQRRGSSRTSNANAAPFGVPVPPTVETRNEVGKK